MHSLIGKIDVLQIFDISSSLIASIWFNFFFFFFIIKYYFNYIFFFFFYNIIYIDKFLNMIDLIEWIQYIFQYLLLNDFSQIILKYINILIENSTNNSFSYNTTNEDPNIWSKFNKPHYEKWYNYEDIYHNKTLLDIIYEETKEKVETKARNSSLTVDEFLKQHQFIANIQKYNDFIKLFDYIDPLTNKKYNRLIEILSTPQCNYLINEQLIIYKKMYIYKHTGCLYIESLYEEDSFKTLIYVLSIIVFLLWFKTITS